jgi:hypothetical protein
MATAQASAAAPVGDPAPMSSRVEILLTKNGKDLVTMSETPLTDALVKTAGEAASDVPVTGVLAASRRPLALQIRDRPGLDVRQCDQERPVGLARIGAR